MDTLPPLLVKALGLVAVYKYPLLYVAMVFEGPVVTVASGFLLHYHVVSIVPLFITLCAGDLTGDVAWYYIGANLLEPMLRKRGHFLSVTPQMVERAKKLFRKYHTKILFISKITIGFGMALGTLMVAGASRVSFKTYMILNTLGELVLVTMLLLIGFYFGNLYTAIAIGIQQVTTIIGLLLALGVLAGLSLYVRKMIVARLE